LCVYCHIKGLLSSIFLGNHDTWVLHDNREVVSDEEVSVESDPLSDLIYVDSECLFADVHKDSDNQDKIQSVDAVVNVGCDRGGELGAVGGHEVDHREHIDDLTNCEDVGGKHVVVHIVVAVKVADQRAENEGGCGREKDQAVYERGGESAQLIVVGTGLRLLGAWIDGQHDWIKLVSWGDTHHMADIGPALQVAFKFLASASNVAANSNNRCHHDHGCVDNCSEGKRQVTWRIEFPLNLCALLLAGTSVLKTGVLVNDKWISLWHDHLWIWNSTLLHIYF